MSNRREFLKNSAFTVAGLSFFPVVSNSINFVKKENVVKPDIWDFSKPIHDFKTADQIIEFCKINVNSLRLFCVDEYADLLADDFNLEKLSRNYDEYDYFCGKFDDCLLRLRCPVSIWTDPRILQLCFMNHTGSVVGFRLAHFKHDKENYLKLFKHLEMLRKYRMDLLDLYKSPYANVSFETICSQWEHSCVELLRMANLNLKMPRWEQVF